MLIAPVVARTARPAEGGVGLSVEVAAPAHSSERSGSLTVVADP